MGMTMDRIQQALQGFQEMLECWWDAYRVAELSYVAINTSEGKRLLAGRIGLFSTAAELSTLYTNAETEHLCASRIVEPIDGTKLRSIMKALEQGAFPTKRGHVPLLFDEASHPIDAFFSRFRHPVIEAVPRLPSLIVYGAPKHELVGRVIDRNELDWELRGAKFAFDGLDELLMSCGFPTYDQMNERTTLEAIMVSPAIILDTSAIKGETANVEFRLAKGLDCKKIGLGLKTVRKNSPPKRLEVDCSAISWREAGDFKVGSCGIAVGECLVVRGFLEYDGSALHQWWISDPSKQLNSRRAMHSVFDPDLKALADMLLFPKKDQAHDFEAAVSVLLFILGFSTASTGGASKLKDGPDSLAVSPGGNVAVIECTLGILDKGDKLSKLIQRTEALRKRMVESNQGFIQIQSVVVSPLERTELAADLETAAKNGIAVVCKDELKSLLEMTQFPVDSEQIFEYAKRLIPRIEQLLPFDQTAGKISP